MYIDILSNCEIVILDMLQALKCPLLDFLMPCISYLGNGGVFWIITGILLLIFKKTRKCGITLLLSLLLSLIFCNLIIKPLVMRTRPFDIKGVNLLIKKPADYSFPSGHSSSSFAGAVSIFKNSKRLGIWAIAIASLIAFSRLYLYVHFLTDVIFGILLGSALGMLSDKIVNKLKGKFAK